MTKHNSLERRIEDTFRYDEGNGKVWSSDDPCTEWEISQCNKCVTPCYFRASNYRGSKLGPNTGKDIGALNLFPPIYNEGENNT